MLKNKLKFNKLTKDYYFKFTLIFIIVLCFVFGYYFLMGRTFIWQNDAPFNNGRDGVCQHYRALVYYAKFLREIIRNIIFNHQLIIPSWDFAIGEGADIISTLHYYVIGDPFTFLSVLVPTKYMAFFYNFLVVLKIYLAGLFFSYLCFKTGQKNKHAILAGSLTYMFCYWMLCNANRHPFFLNSMVYFPLIILGIEKIIKNEKPYLLIGTVFISALSNFYFFYMIVLLTIIYTLVRLIILYKKDVKKIFSILLKIGLFSIIGLLLASIIFLPMCYTFLSDSRMNTGVKYNILYPISYYSRLPSMFFSTSDNYWLCMGYSAPAILAIFMLFIKRKENLLLKVLIIISIIFIMIPIFGQVLNGFSYMCNRWSFALALLVSYILVVEWDNLLNINKEEWKKLFIYLMIYAAICILFSYSKRIEVFISLIIVIFALIVISPIFNDKDIHAKISKILLGSIICSIIINGYLYYSIEGINYSATAAEISDAIQEFEENETKALKDVFELNKEHPSIIRFSGRDLTKNANISAGLSSTQFYWSISNPYSFDYRKKLELREYLNYSYNGYDDRTILNTLAGVKYFVIFDDDNNSIPYNFKYIDTFDIKEDKTAEILKKLKSELNDEELSEDQITNIEDIASQNYKIYKNNNSLPLVYMYNNYILENEWDNKNAVEKQENMLYGVVIDKDIDIIDKKDISTNAVNIPYTIEISDSGISQVDNSFVVTSTSSTITLKFEGIENAETYLSINGLNFVPSSTYDLYFGDNSIDPNNLYSKTTWDLLSVNTKEKLLREKFYWNDPDSANINVKGSNNISKNINCYTNDYKWYNGRHDFLANLGYEKNSINSITIKFSKIGKYSFDSLSVICQSFDDYNNAINELKKDQVKDLKISTDTVKCNVNIEQPKIMVFAIPYSEGWEAYVDGNKVQILQANIKNMAVVLNEGEHNIELKYHTPLLKIGFAISVCTFILGGLFVLYNTKIKNRKR